MKDRLTTTSLTALILCVSSGVLSLPLTLNQKLASEIYPSSNIQALGTSIFCDTCEWLVDKLQKMFESNVSEDLIAKAIIEFCELFKIEDKYICSTIVPEFKDEVLYIFAHTFLSPREICAQVLGSDCAHSYDPFNQTWGLTIPPNKPPVKPVPSPQSGSPVNRILQLSDIHWDAQYTPGLTTECGEPLCCRPPNEKATNPEDAAGIWGDSHCDPPYKTIVNLMEHLNRTADQFDWVYITGDLPAHNDWTQTRDNQTNVLITITKLIKTYLPGKPLYFTIGNHESSPVNSFPPPFITGKQSLSWLLDTAAEVWGEWLTDDAIKTLKKAGYYSVNVKPDLKVISLQTNFCNSGNWWLLINSTDPGDMLEWLIDELLKSEKKGEKVHIIGHIPPGGNTCMEPWSSVYHHIIWRFESTVIGQFLGHVHEDTFTLFFADEENTTRPINVAYLSPSVTPVGGMNLGYRIYDIDGTYKGSTRITLDHSTYILNITEANLTNKPKWMLEYSAKDAYNMTSLLPVDWANLVQQFENDDDLFQKYYSYQLKSFSDDDCNGICKREVICKLRRSRSHSKCINMTPSEQAVYLSAKRTFCDRY